MSNCTVPSLFPGFRDWYDRLYGHLCDAHDVAFIAQQGGEFGRLAADFTYAAGQWAMGCWHRLMAFATLYVLLSSSWIWWYNLNLIPIPGMSNKRSKVLIEVVGIFIMCVLVVPTLLYQLF